MRRLLPFVLGAVLTLPLSANASPAATKLTGTVGPGFTITLKKAGRKVTSLPAGKYTITVTDKASIHNFVLRGPGVSKTITSVGFTGRKTVTLTFKKGRYTYVCTPHRTVMKGSFTVK